MPVNLQKVSLTKGNPGLSKVVVGLGWRWDKACVPDGIKFGNNIEHIPQ